MRQLAPAFAAIAIIFTNVAVPALAWAQGSALALALCRKVSDDQARLKCYDAAFDSLIAKREDKATEHTPKPGAWRIEDQKSPIDDSPEVTAVLFAIDGGAFLVARCKEKKTELILRPSSFFIGSTSSGVKMVLRVNDAPAVTESWSSSTNGQAAFSRSAIQTLKLLPENGRLFVRAFDFQGSQNDATFDLGAVSEVREKFRETCKWPEAKGAAKKRNPSAVAPSAK